MAAGKSQWPARLGPEGPSVVVYSRAEGWRDKPNVSGWPFMEDGAGELRVNRTWWDEDTNTIVVIVD